MKVGVIASELEGPRTGVGRYLEGLFNGLSKWNHGVEWHLFFQGGPISDRPTGDGIFSHFSGDSGSRVLWEQLWLARELARHNLDLLFGPAYTLPFGIRFPSVVTLHDLSFEILPEDFGFRERWRRRLLARRAARVANRVLTDTEFMAGVVAERYGIPEDRLGVVPLGIDTERFSSVTQAKDERILRELGVRPPFVLFAGSVFERRLPLIVLEAFSALRRTRPDLRLVIAGANRMRRPERFEQCLVEKKIREAVIQLGWVEENSIAPLYRSAELSIYVSLHEGFGIPPLESLACGTPVVVGCGLSLDHAWPDYPFRCDQLSASAVAKIAESILSDPLRTTRIMKDAETVVTSFDWEQMSRKLVAELLKTINK